jgi:hypothetical protein
LSALRLELTAFAAAVHGDEVAFFSSSYRDWIAEWRGEPRVHGEALLERFRP